MRHKNKGDFLAFIDAMQGKKLLHLGHKGADCDALGSAFALSCVLPGDIGFASSMKATAESLAEWLEIAVLIDPDPATYDYVIIHDTCSLALLGLPLPERYALFDHHEPGGHRYAEFHSELAAAAEWAWVRPLESTCSLLVDLFQAHAVKIDQRMAVALAAGIVTDTIWLRQAHAHALRRLATVLDAADLHVEDVFAVTDSPERRAARRPIILEALRGTREQVVNGWSILIAETDSQDNGFVVTDMLKQLGCDVNIVGFLREGQAMVMAECDSALVEKAGINLLGLMEQVARKIGADDVWGSRVLGRVVAATSPRALLQECVAVLSDYLA